MSETGQRPPRIFRKVDSGGETNVWAHRRGQNGQEGRAYLKDFDWYRAETSSDTRKVAK